MSSRISGSVVGPFQGIPDPRFEASSRLTVLSPLERLPKQLYHYQTRFMTLTEVAQMTVSLALEYLTTTSRRALDDLDLTGRPLVGELLQKALDVHPNIAGLIISNYKPGSAEAEALGPILKIKPLKRLTVQLPNLLPDQGDDINGMWQKFLENLDLSKMERLVCPNMHKPLRDSFWTQLGPKLSASSLKYIVLTSGFNDFMSRKYLQSLPKTLEHLNLDGIHLTSKFIDIILEKFNLEAMRSCNLEFSEEVEEEKVQKLLKRLPLSEMAQIRIKDKDGQCLTHAAIQQITVKLADNKHLETLEIGTTSPGANIDSFIPLILALRSPVLRSLVLDCTNYQIDFHKLAFMKYLIIQQAVLWASDLFWSIKDDFEEFSNFFDNQTPALSEARALFQAHDLLIREINQAGESVPAELRQKQLLLLTLESQLNNHSYREIFKHYAELHNTIDPAHQIENEFEYFVLHPKLPEDLANPSTINLIRKLEELHQEEKRQIENMDAASFRPVNQDLHKRIQEKLWKLYCTYLDKIEKN